MKHADKPLDKQMEIATEIANKARATEQATDTSEYNWDGTDEMDNFKFELYKKFMKKTSTNSIFDILK